jgi:hypothetical protein
MMMLMLDNDNDNDNYNNNGFIGHSRVSCFSLDSPRPWSGSALLAPFCWDGARWEIIYLGVKLAGSTKGVYSTDVFQMGFLKR